LYLLDNMHTIICKNELEGITWIMEVLFYFLEICFRVGSGIYINLLLISPIIELEVGVVVILIGWFIELEVKCF
jgi:hypothetical protein